VQCWKGWSDEIMRLETQLASATSPAFTADVRQAIATLRAQLFENASPLPAEFGGWTEPKALAAMQGYFGGFGELLSAWPALVATARRLPMSVMLGGSGRE
jgi:hypothetical protein